jgi:hypothetical protein
VYRFLLHAVLWALAAAQASAQIPRIGIIDFYGLKKVPESKLRAALGAREGDPLPSSKGDAEERLEAVEGVVAAHLEAVCCEDGQTVLYVGIEERGAPRFDVRNPPAGEAALPEEVMGEYRRLLQAVEAAARRGVTAEDLTEGHALSADPAARSIQETLPSIAEQNLELLRDVLRNAAEEQHRAAAALMLAYAPRKSAVVNDLQFALKDSDAGVRNEAARALVAFAVRARLDPESQIKISPTWFIEMLNSLSWSDRNRAVSALQVLTDSRDASVLDQLRTRAVDALIDMARWKAPAHALPSYFLLGRVAGWSEQQIQQSWSKGDRQSLISAISAKRK